MESPEAAENPYASPRCVDVQPDAESLLKATTRLYRGMGWFGVAYISIVYLFMTTTVLSQSRPDVLRTIPMSIGCGVMVAFFLAMVRTAKHLGTDLDRYYRRARWIAVLAAAFFFPILTVPAFLAVRRLEKYRDFMTAQQPEEDSQ